MNRTQRVILSMGVALAILSGVFPPYRAERLRTGDNIYRFLGYRPWFRTPSPQSAFKAIHGFNTDRSKYKLASEYQARIDLSRFLVQTVVLVLATTGLVMLFGTKRRSKTEVSQQSLGGDSGKAADGLTGAPQG